MEKNQYSWSTDNDFPEEKKNLSWLFIFLTLLLMFLIIYFGSNLKKETHVENQDNTEKIERLTISLIKLTHIQIGNSKDIVVKMVAKISNGPANIDKATVSYTNYDRLVSNQVDLQINQRTLTGTLFVSNRFCYNQGAIKVHNPMYYFDFDFKVVTVDGKVYKNGPVYYLYSDQSTKTIAKVSADEERSITISTVKLQAHHKNKMGETVLKFTAQTSENLLENEKIYVYYANHHDRKVFNKIQLSVNNHFLTGFLPLAKNFAHLSKKKNKKKYYILFLRFEIVRANGQIEREDKNNRFYTYSENIQNPLVKAKKEWIEFTELPLNHPATCLSMTEDENYLLVGDEASNKLSVLQIKTGKWIKTISTQNPKYILCRRGVAYVANFGIGKISVFSQTKNWELTGEIVLDSMNVKYLSAPSQKYFKGEILATTDNEQIFLVNIDKNTSRRICRRVRAIAKVSFNGEYVIAKGYAYAYSDFTTEKYGPISGYGRESSFVYQVNNSCYWIGKTGIYWGIPPQKLYSTNNEFIIANRKKNIIYTFKKGIMRILELNQSFKEISRKNYTFPNPIIPYQKTLSSSYAATNGNKTSFFVFDSINKKIYYKEIKYPIKPVTNPKNTTTSSHKTTTGKDILFKTMLLNAPAYRMTLTEDGKYLLISSRQINQVFIWDVEAELLSKSVSVNNPGYILCRRGKAYIINPNQGTISVISKSSNWKLENIIQTGEKSLYYLSAPGGNYFDNKILGSTKKKSILIDCANNTIKPLHTFQSPMIATMSFDGKYVIEQEINYRNQLNYYDYQSYRKEKWTKCRYQKSKYYPFLYQVRKEGYWFGNSGTYWGIPPRLLEKTNNSSLIIPDRKNTCYYEIVCERNNVSHVKVKKTGPTFQNIKNLTVDFPVINRLEPFLQHKFLYFLPYAVTSNNKIYIFLLDVYNKKIVYSCYKPAKEGKIFAKTQDSEIVFNRQVLFPGSVHMQSCLDNKNILLLQGNTLKILDSKSLTNLTLLRTVKLEDHYEKIYERKDYYVAMTPNYLALVDKKTFSITKEISFGDFQAFDLAIHPSGPVSFIAIRDLSVYPDKLSNQYIMQIDEKTGKTVLLKNILGKQVKISPDGRYLFSAVHGEYYRKNRFKWDTRKSPQNGVVDILMSFRFEDGTLTYEQANFFPGDNGKEIEIAPDGKALSYLLNRRYAHRQKIYTISALSTDDINKTTASYKAKDLKIITYHPILPIVAGVGKKEWTMFHRETGKILNSTIIQPKWSSVKDILALHFTPSGDRLLIVYTNQEGQNILEAFPLKLSDEQVTILKSGAQKIIPIKMNPWVETIVEKKE